ncbi:MAG: hypothetical protein JO031_08845 [Ktedonobacteraceae bacterium]|nr:hypothetical protein [Ktedonobacteraceae bacterium]
MEISSTAVSQLAWMLAHAEIELVSRDRGGDYATAASQGAPSWFFTLFHYLMWLYRALVPDVFTLVTYSLAFERISCKLCQCHVVHRRMM